MTAFGPQMVETQCPNCGKRYETDFPTREAAVAAGGTDIQREQHQTGICSDKCWDEFSGIG
jgi:sarcosine oxidase delta subunit